jgi:hypothetical protein
MPALAAAHGVALVAWPVAPVIALGVWWSSNTIAHNFIHRPFFHDARANRLFGLYLSVLLGIPQSAWRDRHLAHHAGVAPRIRATGELGVQVTAVLALWIALAAMAPSFFVFTYLPGYAVGLLLCALHGHYEHHRGTTSHYGRIYNALFFNDGYHVEHHARPGVPWSRLPEYRDEKARHSRWPACLRWLDALDLVTLERLALKSRLVQRALVRAHQRALAVLLRRVPHRIQSIAIVGGGLFPRSAIALRRLYPDARLTIIDGSAEHLECARHLLDPSSIAFTHAWFSADAVEPFDVVVFPLSFIGDRAAIYRQPPARAILVHDWIWRRRGDSRIVSFLLLKRLNLVCR